MKQCYSIKNSYNMATVSTQVLLVYTVWTFPVHPHAPFNVYALSKDFEGELTAMISK